MPSSVLVRVMKGKDSKRKQTLKKFMYLAWGDAELCAMGAESAGQVPRSSLAVYLNEKKDERTANHVIKLSCDRGPAGSFLNSGQYFQLLLETNEKVLSSPFRTMKAPASSDSISF